MWCMRRTNFNQNYRNNIMARPTLHSGETETVFSALQRNVIKIYLRTLIILLYSPDDVPH